MNSKGIARNTAIIISVVIIIVAAVAVYFAFRPGPAPLPGEFELSDLVVEPTEVDEGDSVAISVDVTNVGETEVTGPVTLKLNDAVEDSKEITLEGGKTTTVTFTVTKDAGDYSVAIGELTGAFTVIVPVAKKKIAVVSDVGGRGDLSFNDMEFKGGEEAEEDFGFEMIEMISKTVADYLPNLRVGAEDPDTVLIVGVGYLLSEALLTVAQEYPDKNFAGIDTYTQAIAVGVLGEPLPNMMDIAYEEHKGSAMIGALGAFLAAVYDKPHIGGVFGMSIPVLYKFEIGYKWGARWATEWLAENQPALAFDYTKEFVLWTYTGTFSDITKGYTAALPMYEAGAVAVFNIAGPLGLGINAVVRNIADTEWKEGKRDRPTELDEFGPPFWIGVDANQDWVNPGFVIASMMKRVDWGVYYASKLVSEGTFRDALVATNGTITIGIGTEVLGVLMEGISVSTLADLDEFIDMGLRAEEMTGTPFLPGPRDWIKTKVEGMREAQPSWIWDAVAELELKIRTGEVEVPLAWTAEDIAYWRGILG